MGRGDLHVHVHAETSAELSEQERALYEQLRVLEARDRSRPGARPRHDRSDAVTTRSPYRAVPRGQTVGVTPAVVLIDPAYARNVGVAVRAASCYGVSQVWFSGQRVAYDVAGRGRLPREERMKGYRDVEVLHCPQPLRAFGAGAVPVAVEVREGAEPLFDFVHPERAVYVFGPEDGSLPKGIVRCCHRFVVIPTRHCLNLAVSVATVLYDRACKRAAAGDDAARVTPGEWEARGTSQDRAVDAWLQQER